MLDIARLDSAQPDFRARLHELLSWTAEEEAVAQTVRAIVADVRSRGDAAVLEHTRRLDRVEAATVRELELPRARLERALESVGGDRREALETAAARLRAYAEHQRLTDWDYREPDGTRLGQKITALERVGLYVPGGKAVYPSSLLMNAVPARVAGVGELIMVVPTPGGAVNDLVLAAAAIVGVDRVFAIGGAQAVAALAYGTETIARVDKIVGPGNAYVAAAKRQVFGAVGIDMLAGPSEVLVVCDGSGEPDWVAMDLFAQAEHDEDARATLLCPDRRFIDAVAASMARLLDAMPRAPIIRAALAARGALIQVRDLDEAMTIANEIAPEHLELSVAEPQSLLEQVKHAGAVFLGPYSAEVLGDYCAGPNHVLPTSRSARFSSPLGVYDFQKRISVIECSAAGAARLGSTASVLARGEGLVAHACSAEYRMRGDD